MMSPAGAIFRITLLVTAFELTRSRGGRYACLLPSGSHGGVFATVWVTRRSCDPFTATDAGRTPGSKITAPVLGPVEKWVVRLDTRGFGVAGSSSRCAVASIVC